MYKKNNIIELRNRTKLLKLCLIPYWVLSAIFLSISIYNHVVYYTSLGFDVQWKEILFLIFFTVVFFIVFLLIILGITSCSSIAYIKLLKKENKLKCDGIYIFSQLFFVLDTIGIIILEKKIKEKIYEVRHNGI
jgi:hypothetical protein